RPERASYRAPPGVEQVLDLLTSVEEGLVRGDRPGGYAAGVHAGCVTSCRVEHREVLSLRRGQGDHRQVVAVGGVEAQTITEEGHPLPGGRVDVLHVEHVRLDGSGDEDRGPQEADQCLVGGEVLDVDL